MPAAHWNGVAVPTAFSDIRISSSSTTCHVHYHRLVGQSQYRTALILDSERFLACLLLSGLRQFAVAEPPSQKKIAGQHILPCTALVPIPSCSACVCECGHPGEVVRARRSRPHWGDRGSLTLNAPGEIRARATQPPGHKDMLPSRPTTAVARGRVGLEVQLGRPHIAPQNCTIVSQCKSASAPCKNCLWRLWRRAFSMLFGPSDSPPPQVYVCMCICMYICVRARVCVHTHTHTYIYLHTHIYTWGGDCKGGELQGGGG